METKASHLRADDPLVEALIDRARQDTSEYQSRLVREANVASVSLAGHGHVLVPTTVLSRTFPRELERFLSTDAAARVLYELGYLIGFAHAEQFFDDRQIGRDEIDYRVLTGPFHFAWAGYGDVDILLLNATADERFVALWDSHDSFRAREGIEQGERRRVCYPQAGYSAGWLTCALGVPLETRELTCRTEGVRHCRFLVAHQARMEERLREIRFHQPRESYRVLSARAAPPDHG